MTLVPKKVQVNPAFIGREFEQQRLERICHENRARILVVYGRRRVGKTELLEQVFKDRNILKFEGIEDGSEAQQMSHVMWQLSEYAQEPILAKYKPVNWSELFKIISEKTGEGEWTIYFEEIQWLANYKKQFVSELKYVWDNYFRYNKNLVLILCGSSPSFIINEILKSKALHNRSQHELHLKELTPIDSAKLLNRRSGREVMDAFLTMGGVPEYLVRLNENSSVFLSLCDNSFIENSFFSKEHSRIFASSFASHIHYKDIIEYLSKKHFATRKEILAHLRIQSGGKISKIMNDLEICGFIRKYMPVDSTQTTNVVRYCIGDAYLHFYFKFIKPQQDAIDNGEFNKNPSSALNSDDYYKWLGFAFERMCRKYHHVIANMLGFSAVQYKAGAYFSKATNSILPGYQIDLIFERRDLVYTICEIKYHRTKTPISVIEEFERKLALFPNKKNYSIHKVLITAAGAEDSLLNTGYFDRIISLETFFRKIYWE